VALAVVAHVRIPAASLLRRLLASSISANGSLQQCTLLLLLLLLMLALLVLALAVVLAAAAEA
jgi:hypothetical protein